MGIAARVLRVRIVVTALAAHDKREFAVNRGIREFEDQPPRLTLPGCRLTMPGHRARPS